MISLFYSRKESYLIVAISTMTKAVNTTTITITKKLQQRKSSKRDSKHQERNRNVNNRRSKRNVQSRSRNQSRKLKKRNLNAATKVPLASIATTVIFTMVINPQKLNLKVQKDTVPKVRMVA